MKKIISLSFLFLGLLSCSDDLIVDPNANPGTTSSTAEFTLDLDFNNPSSPVFIIVHNQKNEFLFDTLTNFISETISLEKEEEDIINVTYGRESNSFFNIQSFVNVNSGSRVSNNLINNLIDNCFENDVLQNLDNVTIKVEGINKVDEIYMPSMSSKVISEEQDHILITGKLRRNNQLQLTIKEEGSESYLSYLILSDNWLEDSDTSYRQVVQVTDFSEPEVYDIELGIEGELALNVCFTTNSENTFIAHTFRDFSDYQSGPVVKLFKHQDIKPVDFHIGFFNSIITNNYSHFNVYSEVPQSIDTMTIDFEFMQVDSSGFNYTAINSYHLNRTKYQYLINNSISTWEVYSIPDANTTFNFPSIPSDYLESLPYIKENIGNPTSVINEAINFDTELINILEYDNSVRFNSNGNAAFDMRGLLIKEF